MANPVLRLRSYTRIVASPPGAPFPAILIDDALDQRLKLDPTVFAVVNTLSEGVQADELASRAQLEPELADRALELLDRMHVLDTEKAREFVADAAAIRELQL
ncbi:MAG: hypothetical protein VX223_10345, partial [Myxococcota bacterium]|nr:hypothetical protein [Myxococcota bacterium]